MIYGRPNGSISQCVKLSGQEQKIRDMLENGFSKSKIARELDVHRVTVSNFIKNRLNSEEELNDYFKSKFYKIKRASGRPKGRKSTKVKLTGKEYEISILLGKGVSKSKIAKKMGVHIITLTEFINNKLTNYVIQYPEKIDDEKIEFKKEYKSPEGVFVKVKPGLWKLQRNS